MEIANQRPRPHAYTLVATLIAGAAWVVDSLVHLLLFREAHYEFIPSDFNELWMRTTIVVLLLAFGMYTDHQTRRLLEKEQEKEKIFSASMTAANHILRNFLNQSQLAALEAERDGVFNPDQRRYFQKTINQAVMDLETLQALEEISAEAILAAVSPTSQAADAQAIARLQQMFDALKSGQTPPDTHSAGDTGG